MPRDGTAFSRAAGWFFLNWGRSGFDGEHAVRGLRVESPTRKTALHNCQRQLRPGGLISRHVLTMGSIHDTGQGVAKVDRRVRVVSFRTWIVKTRLAAASGALPHGAGGEI